MSESPGDMPRRRLGAGGPIVSRIGLGMAALGRPGYITLGHGDDFAGGRDAESMRANAGRMLDAARAAGISYVDAARSYGRAEEFLASWLAERAPSDLTIGSKWGYTYTAEWTVDAEVHEVKDHSAEVFRRQLAESRDLLGDRLAVYQIHSATLESGVLDDDVVLAGLAALRDQGVIVGLTTSGPRQAEVIERAITISRGGRPLFGTVQATWNLLEVSAGPALAAAHDAGFGVIVKEALANGRLTERGSPPAALTNRAGSSPDALAIAAVLAQPWADVVLLGAATADQLTSNLRALAIGDGDLPDVAGFSEDPDVYWQRRAALAWN